MSINYTILLVQFRCSVTCNSTPYPRVIYIYVTDPDHNISKTTISTMTRNPFFQYLACLKYLEINI